MRFYVSKTFIARRLIRLHRYRISEKPLFSLGRNYPPSMQSNPVLRYNSINLFRCPSFTDALPIHARLSYPRNWGNLHLDGFVRSSRLGRSLTETGTGSFRRLADAVKNRLASCESTVTHPREHDGAKSPFRKESKMLKIIGLSGLTRNLLSVFLFLSLLPPTPLHDGAITTGSIASICLSLKIKKI